MDEKIDLLWAASLKTRPFLFGASDGEYMDPVVTRLSCSAY